MAILCGVFVTASALGAVSKETARLFPARFGDFKAQETTAREAKPNDFAAQDYGVIDGGARRYAAPDKAIYVVEILRTSSGSAAFSLLTTKQSTSNQSSLDLKDVGGYGVASTNEAMFVKDNLFVRVKSENELAPNTGQLTALTRLVAASISGEPGGVPILVQHVPDWEQIQNRIKYAVSAEGLRRIINQDSVLDKLNFAGGTEAVVADYDASPSTNNEAARLVIIEHLTPQLASENYNRINNAIAERRERGESVPSDFRRTGNYLVFVFGVSETEAALALTKRVRYEQDVRWLGDYPFAQERAERAYTMMTISVLIGSLKTTGLAIALSLLVGGMVGGAVFMRRRSQNAAMNIFTDAGGMVRLNIDEMTTLPPSKLIGNGDERRG